MILSRRTLILALAVIGCHRTAVAPPVREPVRTPPVRRDTVAPPPVVVQGTRDVREFFKDTALAGGPLGTHGRKFDLRKPDQRDSLRAVVARERAQWRAVAPRDYRFLLRVGCFCPGPRGWLLMEVRGQTLRAWDPKGKSAPLIDWNTFSIDGTFDNVDRSADQVSILQIDFDPRWHFPTYVYVVNVPGPDAWGITEARGLKPILPGSTGR